MTSSTPPPARSSRRPARRSRRAWSRSGRTRATSPRCWCPSTPSSAASSPRDIINEETGLIWAEAGDELTWDIDAKTGDVTGGTLKVLLDNGVTEIPTLDVDNITVGAYIRNTMAVDKNMNRDQALMDIYRVMRPGEPPTVDAADSMFQSLFFDPERYDLSAVGRVKMNMRLDLDAAGHHAHAAQRGHHRLHQGAGRPARRPRRDRRHRPPRQPPGALGRRADGEPVPRRPAPHGARHPRAHVLASRSTR